MGIFLHSNNQPTLVDIFTFGLHMCKVKPRGEGIIETWVHEARVTFKFCNALPMCFTRCEPNKLHSYCDLSIFSFENAMFEGFFPFHSFH